ncbi:MAG: hypothetical protein HQK53_18255 [Oligoflexia bacterium]|nr:hypothetical protein [Oligoflexia bacterium]
MSSFNIFDSCHIGHSLKIALTCLTIFFSINLCAIDLEQNHKWSTPQNIGLRSSNPVEAEFIKFLAPIKRGYSDPNAWKKEEFIEVVMQNYLKLVVYLQIRGIYHFGTWEENGICKTRAVQHTWVYTDVIDSRDVAIASMPHDQYKIPALNPTDWCALGEISTSCDSSLYYASCAAEKVEVDDFYNFTRQEFNKALNNHYPKIVEVLRKMSSEGRFVGADNNGFLPFYNNFLPSKRELTKLIDEELRKEGIGNLTIELGNHINEALRR